jgi:hypothetical protein
LQWLDEKEAGVGGASGRRTENKLTCKQHVGFPLPLHGVLFNFKLSVKLNGAEQG